MLRRLGLLSLLLASPLTQAADLVVYSARNEQLIQPLFERYTAETGVKIDYITDKEAVLLQRLQAEGSATPADLLLTVDAGNLWQAAEMKLLRPVKSAVLEKNIPPHLRDPGNQWFGLSVRARTMVYSIARVKPAELSTYEALADAAWKNRLCLRTSKKVYNQSLVAMMLSELGEPRTENIVKGWVSNLAVPPLASDNEVIEAIAAGRCDVGLVNTYYYGRLLREKPELPVKLFFPNQGKAANSLKGVHVNVAGGGVTAHAKHPEAAQKFVEWLSAGVAQGLFAGLGLEYPVNPAVAPDARVANWGSFRQDLINVAEAGKRQADAVRLMDRANYK